MKRKPMSKGLARIKKMKVLPRYLMRELNFQCLVCGEELKKFVRGREIHIHICEKCRPEIFIKYREHMADELAVRKLCVDE